MLVVLVALVVVLATVLIGRRPGEASPEEALLVAPPAVVEQSLPAPELLLPDEHARLLSHRFRPSREPRSSWTESDLERFWHEPEAITRSHLLHHGHSAVETMFDEVP